MSLSMDWYSGIKHLPPQGTPLVINKRHPLAQKLVSAYVPGISFCDINRLSGPLRFNGGNPKSTRDGLGWIGKNNLGTDPYGITSGLQAVASARLRNPASSGLTIFWRGHVATQLASYNAGWATLGDGLHWVNSGGQIAGVGWWDPGFVGSITGVAGSSHRTITNVSVAGQAHSIAGAFGAGRTGRCECWLDGVNLITGTASDPAQHTLVAPMTTLAVASVPDIYTNLVYFFDKILNDTEMRFLNASPYALLSPQMPRRIISSVPTSVAATFYAYNPNAQRAPVLAQ